VESLIVHRISIKVALIFFNYFWWHYFWGVKCHEELELFPHGSLGREAVAIQSAIQPRDNCGEILQSE